MESREEPGDITQWLRTWGAERGGVPEELLQLTYDRLRYLAGVYLRRERPDHTLQPTALVNELYLRLASANRAVWKDRDHFYSFCARAMRHILTDHAKARLREKRHLDMRIPLTEDIPWLGERDSDIAGLDSALSKLEAVDTRKARVLELRVYLGCTAAETAEIMGLSKATADRDMTMARAWLCRELRPREGSAYGNR
ncbi:Sigma factor, ECF-like family protein [Candidatus Sulfopaludibacter sp. SbA4]|nr:Sigma factor, ECF-like family protein [Candidatus Sulfopaludibacter sp. SbA4]